MSDERAVIRYVSWRDLFPWLILLRTFRLAIQPVNLALATMGLVVSLGGWNVGAWVFLPREKIGEISVILYPSQRAASLEEQLPAAVREYLPSASAEPLLAFFELAEPVRRLFQLDLSLRETAYYLFGSLWSLAAWSLVGGFITRYAVVRLATEQEPPLRPTAQFTLGRYGWYFLTPLYPLLGVALIAAPIAVLGLPMRLQEGLGSFGILPAGFLWIFVVLGSLAGVWLLAGLLFGWPLMWPAISAERDGDPFDAFSRSFSYVYGKPLHYLFYVVVATLFGALCLAVVQGAVTLVTEFGFWSLAWGCGWERAVLLRTALETGGPVPLGAQMIGLVVGLVGLVGRSYAYSFFWCVASAIYLLLRHDVDEKELDEVYLETPPTADPTPVSPPAAEPTPQPEASEQPATEPN